MTIVKSIKIMGKLKINYVILFSIFFIAILNLIYEFGKFIPYYEKNIIHPLTLFDNPYFKKYFIS